MGAGVSQSDHEITAAGGAGGGDGHLAAGHGGSRLGAGAGHGGGHGARSGVHHVNLEHLALVQGQVALGRGEGAAVIQGALLVIQHEGIVRESQLCYRRGFLSSTSYGFP